MPCFPMHSVAFCPQTWPLWQFSLCIHVHGLVLLQGLANFFAVYPLAPELRYVVSECSE